MKGLIHIVLGSIAGGLLGASAFFAVDALMPKSGLAVCLTERCDPLSEYQDPLSEYQDPLSGYQDPLSEYQDPLSDKYIPNCKLTEGC